MNVRRLLILLPAAVTVLPLHAQVAPTDPGMAARGYADPRSPAQARINAAEGPTTNRLNAAAAADARVGTMDRARYEADRAAYLAAVSRHHAAVDRRDVRVIRQQRAYAEAMAAWRAQAEACRRGKRRLCDAPAPRVADYY